MSQQHGPRDLTSVLEARYTLTDAGWAATEPSSDRPWWARADEQEHPDD